LLEHGNFVQESINKLRRSWESLIDKKHFLHGMYGACNEMIHDLQTFFFAEQLPATAWHLLKDKSDNCREHQFFVSELINIRNRFDTKENKFFFRFVHL